MYGITEMEQTLEELFHDFKQELIADAEVNKDYQLTVFLEMVLKELTDTGFIEGFELCFYLADRGMRVDGYWFNDEGALDLFIADFNCRTELSTLTKTEVNATFKRLINFFTSSREKELYKDLEETSPGYGLSREIHDRGTNIEKINFYLISERSLSDRIDSIDNNEICELKATYHIWDVSRLMRQRASRSQKEPLDIDFFEMFKESVSCLPAHLGSDSYQSYLIVMPAPVLASLYDKYGARLLEQNVRCFLQARGNVNKGIRSTIINEPAMFFAYNNGITATAESIEVENNSSGLRVKRIKDLQIVNGGQTTASLYHTARKDKVSLEGIFVQMKLSVIDDAEGEKIIPRISEYANTQNRVNAADFFSNHPFHIRIEDFSRRMWAPAQKGAQRETKWFYERARGQYADAQADLTLGEKKKYKAENPRNQMFTKTDLAKFENVWDENPRYVNLGAQKNFAKYATRIGGEWEKNPAKFNELYYKRVIARAIIFKKTEKLISSQEWYNGGYRANIVAYSLALLGYYCKSINKEIDFISIWNKQEISSSFISAIEISAKMVHDEITSPRQGISNVTEWCKKEGCWQQIKLLNDKLKETLPESFNSCLLSIEILQDEKNNAKKVQKIDDGIEAQKIICEIPSAKWTLLYEKCEETGFLSPKELSIVKIATQIPKNIPSDKQSIILLSVLKKVVGNGILVRGWDFEKYR